MSKSINVDFVTRQIEVDTDGKEYYVSAAVAAKDAEQSMLSAQNAAKEVKEIYGDGNFTPLSDLLGGLGTKLKRWGAIFANKVFASNLPIVYNSVAEMKADTMLWEGMNTKTLGYYAPNDGGCASYLIRAKTDSDVNDGGSIHELSNGLVAELIVENGTVCPEQFGAKGDGVSDDANAIQLAANCIYNVVFSKSKTYKIDNGVVLKNNKEYDFNYCKLICNAAIRNEYNITDSDTCIKHYLATSDMPLYYDSRQDYVAGYVTRCVNGTDIVDNPLGNYTYDLTKYELNHITIKNVGEIDCNNADLIPFYIYYASVRLSNVEIKDSRKNQYLFFLEGCVDSIIENCNINVPQKPIDKEMYPFMVRCCTNTLFTNCNINNDVWHCISTGGNKGVSVGTKYVNCALLGSYLLSIGEHENTTNSVIENCIMTGAWTSAEKIIDTVFLQDLKLFGRFDNGKNFARSILIDNCKISNNSSQNLYYANSSKEFWDKITVRNCEFDVLSIDGYTNNPVLTSFAINEYLVENCYIKNNLTFVDLDIVSIPKYVALNTAVKGNISQGLWETSELNDCIVSGCICDGNIISRGTVINSIANRLYCWAGINNIFKTSKTVKRLDVNNTNISV